MRWILHYPLLEPLLPDVVRYVGEVDPPLPNVVGYPDELEPLLPDVVRYVGEVDPPLLDVV